MPDVFNRHGFGPSVAVKQPSSCSWVDHLRFGSTTSDWVALLGLAFASPPFQKNLGSPLIVTRRLIKQKARHHPPRRTLTPCKHIISGTISLRSQRFFSPFPPGTAMFHYAGCRDASAMDSQKLERVLLRSGYPIRKSTGQSVFAAVRSLSQLTTSFIAYWHQGIHDALFVA